MFLLPGLYHGHIKIFYKIILVFDKPNFFSKENVGGVLKNCGGHVFNEILKVIKKNS